MSRELSELSLVLAECERELQEFRSLLAQPQLAEGTNILPFLATHPQLAALLGSY